MKLLTRWGRDKMTSIYITFPNTFYPTTKKSLQFVSNGAVNHKSKLVQAMAWHREDTKPLPESVVIQANGAYMSLSDWLSWLLHRIGKIYPCGEKRYCMSTRGIPSPYSWKLAIPTPQVGSGPISTQNICRRQLTIHEVCVLDLNRTSLPTRGGHTCCCCLFLLLTFPPPNWRPPWRQKYKSASANKYSSLIQVIISFIFVKIYAPKVNFSPLWMERT